MFVSIDVLFCEVVCVVVGYVRLVSVFYMLRIGIGIFKYNVF